MRNIMVSMLVIFGFGNAFSSDFPPNIDGNQQVIQELIKRGSNPNKLHSLEHHFYAASYESLNALIKRGTVLGYRAANIGEGISEGNKYWYGDLIKEARLNLTIINQENSLMLKLAAEFNAEYDGWGTLIVN